MIVEGLLSLLVGLVNGVLDALPTIAVPGWFADIGSRVSDVLAYAGGLGAWLPLSLAGQVFSFVLVCVGIGFLIKLVRIVASFLLAGGGGAG